MQNNKHNATTYSSLGWKILPCHGIDDTGRCTCNQPHGEPKDVGKHPAIGEWNARATTDQATIGGWWGKNPNYNIGVFCQPSGFFVIDVDPRSGGVESFDKFEDLLEHCLPKTVMAYTGTYMHKGKPVRGRHYYFKADSSEILKGNLKADGFDGIDIKHNGYVIAAPSRHFSGVNYEWVEGHAPWEVEMAQAPIALLEVVRKSRQKPTAKSGEYWKDLIADSSQAERVDVDSILENGIDEGERALVIYKLVCSLANKMGTSPLSRMAIETMMIRFNQEKVRPPMELEGPNSLLMHTHRAMDFVAENPTHFFSDVRDINGPEQLHDAAVVEWLTPQLATSFCWNTAMGWSNFSEGYWKRISNEEVREFLRVFLHDFWKEAKSQIHDPNQVSRLTKLVSQRNIKSYEEALRGSLFIPADAFDQNQDLLNVKNGVVDLRTKELLPHDSNLRFTQIVPVDYVPTAKHPDWTKALSAIPENALEWVQVFFGQSCSARTANDDYVAVFTGGGRNGKSTIVHLPRVVLGPYAASVSDRVLIARTIDHSTDLTDLQGKRLAILEEFPDSVPLNGRRLKEITGTAVMTARKMREDNHSWKPTHTFIITTNHEIRIASGDDGTWRRLAPIKFPYRYVQEPVNELDRKLEANLRERLIEGLEGQHKAVLAWLVDGAFEWYQRGCRLPQLPQTSLDALAEWRNGQDLIGSYIQENLTLRVGEYASLADIHCDFVQKHPEEEDFRNFGRFSSAFVSHEFFNSNGLEKKRMRTSSLSISRPKPLGTLGPLKDQSMLVRGLAFK